MDDNNNNDNNNNEENLKSKKIRRILLLKTDDELKKATKKNSKIMINSKTIQEMNKSYNLYNILLSEKSKIYFNYVKTEEKIVPNDIKPINTVRILTTKKKIEQPIKILNITSMEDDYSNSPINFFPKKINLGIKKINIPRRRSKNFTKIPSFFENINLDNITSNREILNKSTKVEKRGLYKLVDKIVNIKMSEDIEDIVKKNILKLRKYCSRLIKAKKRVKKMNKQKVGNNPRKSKDKNEQRNNCKKRMTINDNKNFFKKSLFGSRDRNIDFVKKRSDVRMKTTKNLHIKIIENATQNLKDKDRNKISKTTGSSKVIKKINTLKKNTYFKPQKKMKIRKMQSLNGNMKNKLLESKGIKFRKNSEINKNDESLLSSFNPISNKNHLLSSKFQRPSKSLYSNNDIKKNNILYNPIKEQKNSKFKPSVDKSNNSKISNNRQKSNVLSTFNVSASNEKKEELRRSLRKSKKYSVKMYEKCLHLNKKGDNFELFRLDEKYSLDKNKLKNLIFTEYN